VFTHDKNIDCNKLVDDIIKEKIAINSGSVCDLIYDVAKI
jgi:hypothetical protein